MFAIVAVGYNRPESMSNLLRSLTLADYGEDIVDLVISIDKGPKQSEVKKVAEACNWSHGEKCIRAFQEKQGLRKHILQCGDLTEKYDAVVVLEDDLLVSKAFYKYVKNAVRYYGENSEIAGISLYSYAVNEFSYSVYNHLFVPFLPAYNGYDTFAMQVAQSWGQCWTKRMWKDFRNWEYADAEKLPKGNYMPECVFGWGASSWKKNFMAYLTKTDKYFIYPYHSYSTNCSEAGTHRDTATSDFQVALVENQDRWNFAPLENCVKYDVFFERMGLNGVLGHETKRNVCMDLYGLRTEYNDADIVISRNSLPYKVIREIGLNFRPMECNWLNNSSGKGLYVYDLHTDCNPPHQNNEHLWYEYNTCGANYRFSLRYGFNGVIKMLKRKLMGVNEG